MLYLDTSVLLPLYLREPSSDALHPWLATLPANEIAFSEWTRTEFVSAIGIKVRTGALPKLVAQEIVRAFQQLAEHSVLLLVPGKEDFLLSSHYLEQFEFGLRAGDALHLAIAVRHRARNFYSLDRALVRSAQKLKIRAQFPI